MRTTAHNPSRQGDRPPQPIVRTATGAGEGVINWLRESRHLH
jgi:hypothetical protein